MKINKQQKNGIIQLSFLIVVGFSLLYVSKIIPTKTNHFIVDAEIQAELEHQKESLNSKNQIKFKKYYINSINDFIGYKLGMTTHQIDKLLAYLESGKLIYSEEQFKKVTTLDSIEFEVIKNRLRFPKKRTKNKKFTIQETKPQTLKKFDLNGITALQFENELKLPKFIAVRIVKFRKLSKGFKSFDEIEKVYNILPYQIERIKKRCFIK